jgi:glycosyltransferase involved in cell wall biosynthesis
MTRRRQIDNRGGNLQILVIAETFPNRIQPWLLNSVEQIILHGGTPWIVASGSRGDSYPAKIDRHKLLDRTVYVSTRDAWQTLKSLRVLLAPWRTNGRRALRGVGRLMTSDEPLAPGIKGAIKELARAPVHGLGRLDLVHAHAMVDAYELLRVPRTRNIPLILTFHGLKPPGVQSLAPDKMRVLFDAATRLLVNTRFAQGQLAGLGCPEDKIEIIPQGIELEEFPFNPRQLSPGDILRLLTVGRLHVDKGHRYCIEAVRRLRDQGISVEYRIVGVGPERGALESLSAELGVAGCVHFLGEADDAQLAREYRQAHLFVLPSLRDREGAHEETQGVVIQEAQACGKIVVATRTGGIPECVEDGVSAFLVPDRDAAALAQAIARVAATPARWDEWQRAGRRWVEEKFSIGRIGDRLWRLYNELCPTSPTPSLERTAQGDWQQ